MKNVIFPENCVHFSNLKENNPNLWECVLHFIWLDVMMLRWLCCNADWMLLLVLFKLMGVVETIDEACVVVMLFAFDVFVCSCALEDEVVVTTAVTAVSATVDVAVLFPRRTKQRILIR